MLKSSPYGDNVNLYLSNIAFVAFNYNFIVNRCL